MAAEEFQESQVIFQENAGDHDDIECYHFTGGHSDSRELMRNNNNNKMKRQKKRNSVPINVPENLTRMNSWFQYEDHSDLFDDDDDDGGGITPPHVILGRRIAGKMAFSVCTGNGRTLKGRDLSQVRNSVLRMTGFLET